MLEREAHLEFMPVRMNILHHLIWTGVVQFADGHQVVFRHDFAVHLLDEFV